jgi:DnaJ-class molecular chaperone
MSLTPPATAPTGVACPDCDGRGQREDDFNRGVTDCPACEGTGRVCCAFSVFDGGHADDCDNYDGAPAAPCFDFAGYCNEWN